MTSVLNVDTIADKAGTGPVGLTKQTAAKARSRADSSATISDSFNIASTVDVATGQWRFNKTNVMSSSNYEVVSSSGTAINSFTTGGTHNTPESTTAHSMSKYNEHTQAFEDYGSNGQGNCIVHGDLA